MFFTVYKITNTINNMIYIGVHKTKDLNDGYMGSGLRIIRAQEKYGIENFTKEYLHFSEDLDEMYAMESVLVDEIFVHREDTYNIREGGKGGFEHINCNPELQKKANHNSKKKQMVLSNNEEWVKSKSEKMSISHKKSYQNGRQSLFNGQEFKGKTHSPETKKKIGEANSKLQQGDKNSQFGTMWIHSLVEMMSKKIKKDEFPEYEKSGWLKGRKMKF